jgi:putative ABC transport system substrate-binding protein
MRRRDFITLLGGAAASVAWPLAMRAQQPGKVARLGLLRLGPASAYAGRVEALRAGLRELGYVELMGAQLELFKEALPTISHVAVLVDPAMPPHAGVPANI